MPCFEPTIAEAYSRWPAFLMRVVFGDIKLDESRLTPTSRDHLEAFRMFRNEGADRDCLASIELTQPDADADAIMAASMRKYVDSRIPTFRVCCFTTKWDYLRMWEDYADGHAGCVLGFRHITFLDTPLNEAEPIEYADKPPVAGSGLDWLLYGDTLDLKEKTRRAVCFSKETKWSFENEWRTFTRQPDGEEERYGHYEFNRDELESVTLGSRATPETAASVRLCLKSAYSQCTLYQFVTTRVEV